MPTDDVRIRNAHGLAVTNLRPTGGPDGVTRRRGIKRAADGAASSEAMKSLISALTDQELEATHEFTLGPDRSATGRRSLAAPTADRSVDLDVDVSPNESAVVLVEQDGEFSWHFPEPAPSAGRRGIRRAGVRASAPTTVTIPIRLHGTDRPARRGASARRGFGIGSIAGLAKGVVLKFVARTAAGLVMSHLERNVRKGIIVIDGSDATAWRRVERLDDLALPDEPLRILLWIHGTFSSTAGAFGALVATPEGQALLAEAKTRYHAVVGYDHPTLSETPLENAVDLVERLGRFRRPMRIDVVTHSRGGLVYRSMVELLLPTTAAKPELGPAVFVGVPNGGTLLAEPDNWHVLVDLYTNVAVGAFRLLQLVPAASAPARILAEIVSGLGAFVKYLADVVVTERVVPGLAAQEPNGEFVKKLNEAGAGEPLPNTCRYLAVTSNFDPGSAAAEKTGLAASFLGRLANGFIDHLFQNANNDLVVNDDSMKRIDPSAGNFIDAALDFGDSGVVYHTVYFAQPMVAQQLRAWLLDDSAREGLMARHGLLTVAPSARSPFMRMRYHHANAPTTRAPVAAVKTVKPSTDSGGRLSFASSARPSDVTDMAAKHLSTIFGQRHDAPPEAHAGIRAAAQASRPRNYAPALVHTSTQTSTLGHDRHVHVVSFAQMHREIPIFGTRAVAELDDAGGLVAAHAKLAAVTDVSTTPTLTVRQAAEALEKHVSLPATARADVAKQKAPLTFFHDQQADTWHLAYLFRDVPATPATHTPAGRRSGRAAKSARAIHRDGHGIGPGPRQRFPRLDYLVDANSGDVVYYYSVTPTAAKQPLPVIPGEFNVADPDGNTLRIFAQADPTKQQTFLMHDPTRFVRTHDLRFGSIDDARVPRKPITFSTPVKSLDPAALWAHANASRVFDFYNGVLVRRGVDDNGMEVINVVNCTSPNDEPPVQWSNAVWWNGKMWYGQMVDAKGNRTSLARHLDIIAHELTHGVTENTSNLVYRDEAGALNESFSDIFGVIIKNFSANPNADPRDWDWEIGRGLGEKRGKPLRNMSNPTITGDPAHTDDMSRLEPGESPSEDNDYGFVHTNSNIHNKAAFNVLTATVAGTKRKRAPLVFQPDDVARLYYFTLQRLDRVATFEDALATLLDVTRTMFPDPAEQPGKLAAITKAYADVGIPRARPKGPAAVAPAKAPRRPKSKRQIKRTASRSKR